MTVEEEQQQDRRKPARRRTGIHTIALPDKEDTDVYRINVRQRNMDIDTQGLKLHSLRLTNPHVTQIMQVMWDSPHELATLEIAKTAKVSEITTRHTLHTLRRYGLVYARRIGKHIFWQPMIEPQK